MDKEKRNKYSKVLLNAYQEGVFKIVWSTSGFSMAVDSKRKEMIPEIKKEDFVEYAFSIIKMVVDLAEERKTDEKYEGDLETAQTIFAKEHDLKNHLYIKKNSKIDCFKLLEYEIISHRSEDNPIDVEATSAILKMVIEKENDETTYAFETSKRDLEDIIDKLVELKEKMDMIQ
ncbi:MAG: hypothetical protein HFI88_02930 [Lachnospiraceae bacterium]|nr:hypothetical protein [Lachnospiraceae bacterium]